MYEFVSTGMRTSAHVGVPVHSGAQILAESELVSDVGRTVDPHSLDFADMACTSTALDVGCAASDRPSERVSVPSVAQTVHSYGPQAPGPHRQTRHPVPELIGVRPKEPRPFINTDVDADGLQQQGGKSSDTSSSVDTVHEFVYDSGTTVDGDLPPERAPSIQQHASVVQRTPRTQSVSSQQQPLPGQPAPPTRHLPASHRVPSGQ